MTLRLPQLEESICGCSLKTATKLIGWICGALSTFSLLIFIGILCGEGMKSLTLTLGFDLKEYEDCSSWSGNNNNWNSSNCRTVRYAPGFMGPLSFFIAVSLIVSATFQSLLLIGVYNNRPNFVHAWIIALIFAIFIDLITIVSSIIAHAYNPFFRLIILSINVYCLLIVNSYHQTMKQGRIIASAPPPAYEN